MTWRVESREAATVVTWQSPEAPKSGVGRGQSPKGPKREGTLDKAKDPARFGNRLFDYGTRVLVSFIPTVASFEPPETSLPSNHILYPCMQLKHIHPTRGKIMPNITDP